MTDNKKTIYWKIGRIQAEVKELVRDEKNNFQKYSYFEEKQVLEVLKPLLDKYGLALLISDDENQPFVHEKEGANHIVKYLKKMSVMNIDDPTNILTYSFWACGSNAEIAKAKGGADTYAIKYMLSKFFLMPVKDEVS